MKYRDHRGSLSDSMETVQEFSTIEEIKQHLNRFYKFDKSVEEIKFKHVGMDDRIGWDTYYVLQRLQGETNFTVAGMSDGKLQQLNGLAREKTVLRIEEIVREYCKTVEPTNVYLAFKKEVDKELIIETKYPIPNENITVMISDIRKDWQLPLAGTKDIGNPKLKDMSKEDFEKTFEILSYAVQEESRIIMNIIDMLGLHKWEHEGKLKRFHYYQGS